MAGRQNIGSGTPWESVAGYSRAVRVGDQVFVSGTTAHDDAGTLQGGEDAYAQAAYILRKIATALRRVRASLEDAVRTRAYVVRPRFGGRWRAHGDAFRHIRPPTPWSRRDWSTARWSRPKPTP